MLRQTKHKKTMYALIAQLTLLCVFLAVNVHAVEISVSARVDKTELTLEDSVTLSVIISGVKNSSGPQLPPLPDFKVQSRGTSSSVQIINGDMTSSATHTYRLIPSKTGTIIIEPITVEIKGKTYSSEPITLTIRETSATPSTADRPVFIETVVSNKKPYVNEEVTLTIRLYRKVNASNLNLDADFKDFHKEELGKAKKYTRMINGIEYRVHDLAVALFPRKPGNTEIPQITIDIDLVYRDGINSGQDPFFNSRTRLEHKVLRSRPIILDVQPLPEANKPKNFSELVGQFEISTELSKTELEAGDTATLSVKIFGQGNVKDIAFNLPKLGDRFKVYPDKPEFKQWVQNNRVTGQKIFTFALVPLTEGEITLQPIERYYFDPKKNDYIKLSTTPLTLKVLPSKSGEKFKVVEGQPESIDEPKQPVKILGKDILPIHTRLENFESAKIDGGKLAGYAFALLGPALAFMMTAFFYRHRERLKYDKAFYRQRIAYKTAREKLDQLSAAGINDQKNFAGELSQILREYIGNKLNLQGTAFTSSEVESKLQEKLYKEDQITSTRKLLEKYEALQFSPDTGGNSDKLLDESREIILQLEKQP